MIPPKTPIESLGAVMTALVVDIEQRSFAEPLRQCTVSMMEGIAQNFGARVNSQGAPWAPRKDKLPHPLLRLSHAMAASLTNLGAPGQVEMVGEREAMLGMDTTVIPYGPAQNWGRPDTNLPAREYAYLTEERLDMLEEIIGDYAQRRIF